MSSKFMPLALITSVAVLVLLVGCKTKTTTTTEEVRGAAAPEKGKSIAPHFAVIFVDNTVFGGFHQPHWLVIQVDFDGQPLTTDETRTARPELFEKDKPGDAFRSGGTSRNPGYFDDLLSPFPTRTLFQKFCLAGKAIPIILARDPTSGKVLETRAIKVNIRIDASDSCAPESHKKGIS